MSISVEGGSVAIGGGEGGGGEGGGGDGGLWRLSRGLTSEFDTGLLKRLL